MFSKTQIQKELSYMDLNYEASEDCPEDLYAYLVASGFIDDEDGYIMLTSEGMLAVGYTKKDVQDLYDDEVGDYGTYEDTSEEYNDEEYF